MLDVLRDLRPDGTVRFAPVRADAPTVKQLVTLAKPQLGLPEFVNDWRSDNWRNVKTRGLPQVQWAERKHVPTLYGAVLLEAFRDGERMPLGLASLRVVTDAGVAYIVDAFQGTTEPENMRYHGLGTGATAEAASQTALVTEFTTEYNPNSTRATGTLTEAAANIFQTVATNNFDAAVEIEEHAILSQAATGGGTMLDRSQFAAVNLASGDGLQSDYRLTLTSGG